MISVAISSIALGLLQFTIAFVISLA